MDTFRVKDAARVRVTGQDFDYYNLVLEKKGRIVNPDPKEGVQLSTKYIRSRIAKEQLPVDDMTDRQIHRLVNSMTIDASINYKKAGDKFEADKFTGMVNIGKDLEEGAKWVPAKEGEIYTVQMNGFWINHREGVILKFDEDLLDKISFDIRREEALLANLANQE